MVYVFFTLAVVLFNMRMAYGEPMLKEEMVTEQIVTEAYKGNNSYGMVPL